MRLLRKIGEFGLIDIIKKNAPIKKDVIKGIGDDAAVLPFNRNQNLILTTDMLIENVHFSKKDNARLVGRKALAVSISDIVAMGGRPKYGVVSLGVSKSNSLKEIESIYQGLFDIAKEFGISIVGGDTVRSKELIINVSLTGEAERKDIVFRSGAKSGDIIFCTGFLGRSLKTKKHLTFKPRLAEAQYLVKKIKPNAMIDISDGLASDLSHILNESQCGAIVDEERIPLTKGAKISQALFDGEDFELIFTLPKKKVVTLRQQRKFKFYEIGLITKKKNGLMLKRVNGTLKAIKQKAYTHF